MSILIITSFYKIMRYRRSNILKKRIIDAYNLKVWYTHTTTWDMVVTDHNYVSVQRKSALRNVFDLLPLLHCFAAFVNVNMRWRHRRMRVGNFQIQSDIHVPECLTGKGHCHSIQCLKYPRETGGEPARAAARCRKNEKLEHRKATCGNNRNDFMMVVMSSK